MKEIVTLRHAGTAAIVDVRGGAPRVLYLGDDPAGHIGDDPAAVVDSLDWSTALAGPNHVAPVTVLPEASLGFPSRPGLQGRRGDGSAWAPRMTVSSVEATEDQVRVAATDDAAGLTQTVEIELLEGPVLRLRSTVANTGDTSYELDGVNLTLPLPGWTAEVVQLGGRWSNEFRPERRPFESGSVEVENRTGRTSHDRFPALFFASRGFTESTGHVWGAHVAWSGNSYLRGEVLGDGRRILQAGELLLPGEIHLEPGNDYSTPWLYLSASGYGLNGVSQQFHTHLRSRPGHPSSARPVTLNTWEAVYFDHDLDTLKGLADRAAAIGVERFVLDDGWFRHRRNDEAGLGDWYVDEGVWPDGLHPLVDHVRGLGMEFGLWFEPEMVNPDSDLFRAHPDWVLHVPDYEPVLARNQLVLDLANPDVSAYLLERITATLSEYDIGYVKWDMNRNLVAPSHDGRATVHAQTVAFYDLVDAVSNAHPDVEIESCSSGGGRADFAVLERTKRIWTSDCNDALDRQRIQRGFSYLFPPEIMGAHIGPPESHTTSRTHHLGFRAATAFFGHLGIEWNVLTTTEAETAELASIIATHKQFRELLHAGTVHRLDHPDPTITAHMVVAVDGSHALASVAQIATSDALAVPPVMFTGLEPGRSYRVTPIELGHQPPGRALAQPSWYVRGEITLTGAQLAVGLQMPILNPESALVLHLDGRS